MKRRFLISLAFVAALAGCDSSVDVPVTTAAPTSTTTATEPSSMTSTRPTTSTTSTALEPVDLIFTGGPIVTMDPNLGTQAAIAINGDRIVAVGSAAEIASYQGPDTVVVDLDGRAVHPGFVDPHSHLLTDYGSLEEGQTLALAAGITSLADASVEPEIIGTFIDAGGSGLLRLRTSLYLDRIDFCGVDVGTWYEEYEPGEVIAHRVRIGGVKIFTDGGACRALATSEPILDGYDSTDLYFETAELVEMFGAADAGGYQLLVHAQGDVAIASAQDAFAEVFSGRPNDLRHRIDHSAVQNEETIGRYSELGLIPVLFGPSSACGADAGWTDFYKEFGDRPGDIIAANPGLPVAWHGDDPSMPPVSPILELFTLVTRAAFDNDGTICDPADWMLGAEVEREMALKMMTINAAYATHQDTEVGSLTPGKYADLLVLTDDLLSVSDMELLDVEVLATIIGGVTEFCAQGAEQVCPGLTEALEEEAPGELIARASGSASGNRPGSAVDGDESTIWSAGSHPEQWIEVDLGAPVMISGIRLLVSQEPEGVTRHVLTIDGEDVAVLEGSTSDGDWLEVMLDAPTTGQIVRITTTESPSWVAWHEIVVETTEG